ncbi:MAG: sulfite exporter TauE/SafE family protein [Aigarchaeota archaeon]|nr:sulfite exporter TauE/SafE family protein [Aigarchaeota archaeon]
MLETWLVVSLILFAVLVGIVAALIGVGGGFLMVPALVLLLEFASQKAVGTSSSVIVATSLSAAAAYALQRRIDYKVGLALAAGTIPGSALGAYATTFVSTQVLRVLFGLFMMAVSLRMVLSSDKRVSMTPATRGGWVRNIVDSKGMLFEYKATMLPGVAFSFLAGVASGLLGIGGGAVMVPVMTLLVGIPMHIAVATSAFMIVFSSSSAAVTQVIQGNVVFEYAAALALGSIVGAQIGAWLARRIRPGRLRKVFGAFLFIIGLRMAIPSL